MWTLKHTTRPIGRKSKLTPETQTAIIDSIAAGNYKAVAAACGCVTDASIDASARTPCARFATFATLVKKAEAQAEVNCVAAIDADPSWQSKAWLLERRATERWGRKDRVESTVDLSVKKKEPDYSKLTEDELRIMVDILTKCEAE